MKKIQVAVIGVGMWGANHIECLLEDGRAEVRWVATQTEKTLKKVMAKYRLARGTLNYRELLADPVVDAVIIATPPFTHAQMALDAIKAGKHVLLEKPMAISEDEIGLILEEAKNHPELVMLECSCRHSRLQPKFTYVKDLISSGKLGTIYHIVHTQLSPQTYLDWNPKALWATQCKFAGGGPFFDWGEYDLSFHLGVLNDLPQIQSISSFKVNRLRSTLGDEADIEQHGAAYLNFDNGLTYYYERGAGVHCEVRGETRIYGTKGGLKFSYLSWEANEIEYFYEASDGKTVTEILTVDLSGHPHNDNIPLINHFLNCIEGKEKPLMPLELAAKHLRIIMGILE